MEAEEFNKLSLKEKEQLLTDRGTYIDDRSIYNQSYIKLYQVGDFYVEAFYNVKTKELEQIITTTWEQVAHNYIDLREVYKSNKGIKPPPKGSGT